MTRGNWLAPLLAIAILLVLLAVLFGPRLYRSWRFNQTCLEMLRDAREGRIAEVTAVIAADQQQPVADLLARYLPADYHARIQSLKLSSWQVAGDETIWAIVTCRTQQDGDFGLYQGKLCWRWRDGRWWWDFGASYGAPFSPSGEPDWEQLGQLVELAEML